MDSSLKQRLVGAVVLIALAVIFLPMLVKGPAPDSGVSNVSLSIPQEPKDDGRVTRELPLVAPGAAPEGGALGMPVATEEPAPAEPAEEALYPAVAAGDYAVSFGSYASAADADKVIAALASAELPAYREAVQMNGREVQRVRIGPFADRAIAESARLRASHVNDKVGAKVVALNADAAPAAPQPKPAPAKPATESKPAVAAAPQPVEPKPAAKPVAVAAPAKSESKPVAPAKIEAKVADTSGTGFVVQVGAFADAKAAVALRDRLRAAGLNAFTDVVDTDAGKRTRVRVGPAMNRAEADALKAQVKAKIGVDGFVRPHP